MAEQDPKTPVSKAIIQKFHEKHADYIYMGKLELLGNAVNTRV